MKEAKLDRAIEAAIKAATEAMGKKRFVSASEHAYDEVNPKPVTVVDARQMAEIIRASITAYHAEYHKKIKERNHDASPNKGGGGET